MAIRKNVTSLTKVEKDEFIEAVLALKATGKYDQYVVRYMQATLSPIATSARVGIHWCPAFLPWHQIFLLDFEQDLQHVSGNPDLGVPYWDWTVDANLDDPAGSSIWDEDFMGGDGDPSDGNAVKTGPFRDGAWEIVNGNGNPEGPLRRNLGASGQLNLPNRGAIIQVMERQNYDRENWDHNSRRSFRNRLERAHNTIHGWVGGSMTVMTTPNDPVFFLHHCFVDKIWCDWQHRYPNQGYQPTGQGPSGQNLNDQMEPTVYGVNTPQDSLSLKRFYLYDKKDRWEEKVCSWALRAERRCVEWAATTRQECLQEEEQGYQEEEQGYQEEEQGYNECSQTEDMETYLASIPQRYNDCPQTKDEGYKKYWTWIKKMVGVMVCVIWTWIVEVVCKAFFWFIRFVRIVN